MAKRDTRRRAFMAGMFAAKKLPLTAPIPKCPYTDALYASDWRMGFQFFRRNGSMRAATSRKVG